MGVESSRRALEAAGVDARQIDCVVVATVSHLLQTPAVATAIATSSAPTRPPPSTSPRPAPASATASRWPQTSCAPAAPRMLVIGVERLSDLTDVGDRGTAFIFADGAGAVVIGPSDTRHRACRVGLGRRAVRPDPAARGLARRDVASHDPVMPHLVMQGNPVFRWASFAMAKVGQQALDRAGITADDLDVFVPHQANMRIIDAMAVDEVPGGSRSPATSPSRGTPRRPRFRSPWSG